MTYPAAAQKMPMSTALQPASTQPAGMSAKAAARLRKPRTRGAFLPIDAARRQLGLLSVGDSQGQARISWLVDLGTRVIADARFLAFGDLASHPIADAFTECARGRTVDDACRLGLDQIEAVLRDDPATPAFADGLAPLAFVRELQERAERALPGVTLLPRPVEKVAYQRKRQADWTPQDEAWFKLSLLKKLAKVDAVAGRVLRERLGAQASQVVEGLHDDFRVVLGFTGLTPEQIPTAVQLIQDALHGELHPLITVEAKADGAKTDGKATP
jgi:NifU-like protein involved in Fe-S cluster formation